MQPPERAGAWPAALAGLLVALAVVLVLQAEGFAAMLAMWSGSTTYRGLFFVPLVALYFLWLRVPLLGQLQPRPTLLGLAGLLPFVLLWLLGTVAQISIAQQVAAVGSLQMVVFAVLGWQACRRLLFPLLLLWLMVPMGEDLLLPWLIRLTIWLTVGGLRLAGMPTVVDGNLLIVDGAAYNIIDGCAGLDLLLDNLLVSLAFANLIYHRFSRRLVYVLAAVPVAIAVNNLRTISVVLISATGIDLASDHLAYGWFLFGLGMLVQMAVGLRFCDTPPAAEQAPAAAAQPAGSRAGVMAVAVAAGLMVALPALWAHRLLAVTEAPVSVQLHAPPGFEPLPPDSADAGAWRPHFPGADAQLQGRLAGAAVPVDFFVAYYWRQDGERELVSWENRFHDDRYWFLLGTGRMAAVPGSASPPLATARLHGAGDERRVVWYWYWVDGRFTASPLAAKLLQAWAVLSGGEQRAALIALSILETGDAAADQAVLQALLERGTDYRALMKKAARG
ncbi:MAG: EpsI family protein [Gammaproteobacteria bacterium]|nr:EpsI family protein [Gammaproteobacteria bacterium]